MIGCFSNPHPDELFYSICARYADRVRYRTISAVFSELFGISIVVPSIHFPRRLGYLVAHLPPDPDHHCTVEKLINEHSLLPFYAPFLPPERVPLLRAAMEESEQVPALTEAGILTSSHIPWPFWLRFCPLCVAEDRQYWGECYWHRLHQLPGVEVCPRHQVFLLNSTVPARPSLRTPFFSSAEHAVHVEEPCYLNPLDFTHTVLLQIARDAEWLLTHPHLPPSLQELHQHYLARLRDQGLATYTGFARLLKLGQAFKNHYPVNLLTRLSCEFDESDENNWIVRLLRFNDRGPHPLRHLLMIHFLHYTAEDFFQLPPELSPFGEGPWPCLNPVCEHYRQPQIQTCQITLAWPAGRPKGVFECSCGFRYMRLGPDHSLQDRFKKTRIEACGPLWEACLREKWGERAWPRRELARFLGTSRSALERVAARLGLGEGREATSQRGAKLLDTKQENRAPSADKVAWHRKKWLEGMRQNPDAEFSTLRKKLPSTCEYLYKRDKEWFQANRPRPKEVKQRNRPISGGSSWVIYWEKLDRELEEQLETYAQQLKNIPGHLIRITRTSLSRGVGKETLIQKKLDKLPKTAKKLDELTETGEAFAVRRIWHVAEMYRQEQVKPNYWKLVQRAHVYEMRDMVLVKEALEAALHSLEGPPTGSWLTESG